MATYKFEQFDLEIINPTVTINGEVGTIVNNNIPSDEAFADVMLKTSTVTYKLRLEGSPKPIDWTMVSLSTWVGTQLAKYIV